MANTAVQLRRTKRQAHPIGKYAEDDSHLVHAAKEFNRTRFIHVVNGRKKTSKLEPSGITALKRIQRFAEAIREEWMSEHEGREHGWQSEAARRCGLGITTMWNIINGKVGKVDSETVDTVVQATGIPHCLICDPEV